MFLILQLVEKFDLIALKINFIVNFTKTKDNMKKYFYILFCLFPLHLLAQNTTIDSVYTEHCTTFLTDGTLHDHVDLDSIRSVYNPGGQLIMRITNYYNYRDSSILNTASYMDTLIYDSVANSIETISGTYINSVFTPESGRKKTYDLSGRMISQDVANYYPDYDHSYYYTYLPNNLMDYYFLVINQTGDSVFTEFTYDANWNQIREQSFGWDNGAITHPGEKKDMYYNASNQLIASDWDLWIDSTFGYEECDQDTQWYAYNTAGQLTEHSINSCPGGEIIYWYTYDVNGNLDSTGYGSINSIQDTSWQLCNAGSGQVINGVASISGKDKFILYPNPSHGIITLKGDFSGVRNELKIADLSGRTVLTKTGIAKISSNYETDISSLSPGIYILQVFDESVHSLLFVKQ